MPWISYKPPDEVVWSGSIVVVAAGLAVLTKVANWKPGERYSSELLRRAKQLTQQALEWHAQSQQDSDPLFAMRHSDYALAYMNAARAILPDATLQRLTSVDVHETIIALESHQQQHAKRLSDACPSANPKKKVSSISWL